MQLEALHAALREAGGAPAGPVQPLTRIANLRRHRRAGYRMYYDFMLLSAVSPKFISDSTDSTLTGRAK